MREFHAGFKYYRYDFWFRGQRNQGSTKLKNKTAALRFEANLIEKLARTRAGIPLDPEPLPFLLFFAAQYLESVKHALRPNTLRGYHTSCGTSNGSTAYTSMKSRPC